jgi:cell wall-associated NlpC family hydrolase
MRLTPFVLTAGILAGCASHAPPERTLGDTVGLESSAEPRRELLLRALSLVGVPYKYGGQSPDTGFDCSGLVHYLYNEVWGVALPRRTQDMSRVGNAIARHDLAPGDLVFFDTQREAYSHVGIYLGNQKFVHAPSSGGRVEVVAMTHRYWIRRYNGARRISY